MVELVDEVTGDIPPSFLARENIRLEALVLAHIKYMRAVGEEYDRLKVLAGELHHHLNYLCEKNYDQSYGDKRPCEACYQVVAEYKAWLA